MRPLLNGGTLGGPVGTPQFPAIAICPGDSFIVHASIATLGAASPRAIASGYLDRLYIFGDDGNRWRIARFERLAAPIKGPFGNLIGLQLFFHEPDRPSLSEVATDLCTIVDADPDDLYSRVRAPAETISLFRTATTSRQLVAVAATLGIPT